jgi:NAD(P)-dependent dehydrogenase (short-subunit alcohol dehydrogenase family)
LASIIAELSEGETMLLEDKVAVVSGVGTGMGREISLALAEQGSDVVLAARTESYLAEVAKEVEALGRRALVVPTDVSDAAARQRLMGAVADEFGRLDSLVNVVAHGGDYTEFLEADLQRWRKVMEINLFATLELTRLAVPLMSGREGRVIMINTMGSVHPGLRGGAYGISKAALAMATRCLALELAPLGIRVNGIHPGPIGGEHLYDYMRREASERGVPYEEVEAERSRDITLGYIPSAKEIAGIAVFLASDLSRSVTGHGILLE